LKEKQKKFIEETSLLKKDTNDLKEKQEKSYEEYNLLIKDTNELKEKQNKYLDENNLLKKDTNELKEKQNKFLEENNLLKKEINELKEKQEKSYEEYNLLIKDTNDLKEKNKALKTIILNNLVKMQAGEYQACFPWNTNHYMHCQSGRRTFKKHINFDKEFKSTPNVIVAIEYFVISFLLGHFTLLSSFLTSLKNFLIFFINSPFKPK
jgi:hypothetical protein